MITLVFILESNSNTVCKCLESLKLILDFVSEYYIFTKSKKISEDKETIQIIAEWAKINNILETKVIDDSKFLFYIYGNEELTSINLDLTEINFNDKYNIFIECEDYIEKEHRINGFLENEAENSYRDLDIILKKTEEPICNIEKRAIDNIIKLLDISNSSLTVKEKENIVYMLRRSNNNENALKILKQNINTKSPKYYNELILLTDKNIDNIFDFFKTYSNTLESHFYYLEYLFINLDKFNFLETHIYSVIYNGYKVYNQFFVKNIREKYNDLVLSILNKQSNLVNSNYKNKIELVEKLKILKNTNLTLDKRMIIPLSDCFLVKNKENIYDSTLIYSNTEEIILISNQNNINKIKSFPLKQNQEECFRYYKFIELKEPFDEIYLIYKTYITSISMDILKDLIIDNLLSTENLNILIMLKLDIKKIKVLTKQIIYLDTIVNTSSINFYKNQISNRLNSLYIGVSSNVIESCYEKLLKETKYALIYNCSEDLIKTSKQLLKKLNLNDFFVIKCINSDFYKEIDNDIVCYLFDIDNTSTDFKYNFKNTFSPFLIGGLGARLFQIASSFVFCQKNNKELVLCKEIKNKYSNLDYFNTIFRKIKKNKQNNPSILLIGQINNRMLYEEIQNFDENTLFIGFTQSERYFINYRKEILDLFEIEPERLRRLLDIYPKINTKYFIHIRRGDYLDLYLYNIDLKDYFRDCIKYIENKDSNAEFIVFSDDLDYCKTIDFLNKKNIIFVCDINLDELDSLYLMTLCKGGIGSNSCFSWWGGYLNKTENKLVIYPSAWLNYDGVIDIGWNGCLIYDMEKKVFQKKITSKKIKDII